MKPLGHKAYGSIPHLPGSKVGEADHTCEPNQALILTEKASRDWTIVVQEKLDGSCMSVAKVGGRIVALGRAGFEATTSPHEHLRDFVGWLSPREHLFAALLGEGERVVGEWLNVTCSIPYVVRSDLARFVAFDLMTKHRRAPSAEVYERCARHRIVHAHEVHRGGPLPVADAMRRVTLDRHPLVFAGEQPEGVVYRAERRGEVAFLAKFVRHDFAPGKYLPGCRDSVIEEPLYSRVWGPL